MEFLAIFFLFMIIHLFLVLSHFYANTSTARMRSAVMPYACTMLPSIGKCKGGLGTDCSMASRPCMWSNTFPQSSFSYKNSKVNIWKTDLPWPIEIYFPWYIYLFIRCTFIKLFVTFGSILSWNAVSWPHYVTWKKIAVEFYQQGSIKWLSKVIILWASRQKTQQFGDLPPYLMLCACIILTRVIEQRDHWNTLWHFLIILNFPPMVLNLKIYFFGPYHFIYKYI